MDRNAQSQRDGTWLLDAADRLLEAEAIASRDRRKGTVTIWVGSNSNDKSRNAYTAEELIEAMDFLIRLGFIEQGLPHRS